MLQRFVLSALFSHCFVACGFSHICTFSRIGYTHGDFVNRRKIQNWRTYCLVKSRSKHSLCVPHTLTHHFFFFFSQYIRIGRATRAPQQRPFQKERKNEIQMQRMTNKNAWDFCTWVELGGRSKRRFFSIWRKKQERCTDRYSLSRKYIES